MAWTENDIRSRFLSDEGAAFTLLFRFENRRARERSDRARAQPLALTVNKSPAAFIFIREIDDLQGENRSTISNEKVEGLWTGFEGACYYFSELYKRSLVTMLTSWKVYLACLTLGQGEEMGGLAGIGFSIRINPTHTTIHVFITTFRASRLCLIHKIGAWKMFGFRMAEHKSRCTVPEQPTGHAGCSFRRGL